MHHHGYPTVFAGPGKREGPPTGYIDVDGIDAVVFAEFYRDAKDDCLRVVLASVRDRQTAEDLVAEAFTRAWASWRKVSRHPAPEAWVVRTALNAHVSRTSKAALAPSDVYFVIHPAAIPQGSTLQVDVLPPGWPPPVGPHPRSLSEPVVSGVGFNGGGPKALDTPTINLSLIYTNSNCS